MSENSDTNAEIARLWNQGYSAGEIKKTFPKITRNAILGRARRHGQKRTKPQEPLAMRLGAKKANATKRKARVAALKPSLMADPFGLPVFNALPGSEPRVWWERHRTECAFPIDADPELLSCCLPVVDGKHYCSKHFKVMFRAVS